MNAGKSSASATVLPRDSDNSLTDANVSLLVAIPFINSTNCITGTGLKKCIPMNFSGLSVVEAKRVIEIDDVFVAKRVCSFKQPAIS